MSEEDDVPLEEDSDPDLDDADDPDLDGDWWDDLRSVFVLRSREPFEDWARQVLGESAEWTLAPIERCHAVLTQELPTQASADSWLQQNYAEMFVRQLRPWTEDQTRWPVDRSFETFLAWFEVIFAPTVDDTTDEGTPRGLMRPFTCDPLSLRQVLAQFLQLPPDGSLHVDVDTGELFAWTDTELEAIHAGDAESYGVSVDEMRELQEAFASESLIEIVHRTDVENVDTMAAFATAVPVPSVRNRLLGALEGRRALTRFKQAIDVAGLRHRWSAQLELAAAETLREFMTYRGVPFVDDLQAEAPPAAE